MGFNSMTIGIVIVLYSILVLMLRLFKVNHLFRKLVVMKDRYGSRRGSIIHYISYVFVPFIIGVTFIILRLNEIDIINIY